jgi:hypothetical protein
MHKGASQQLTKKCQGANQGRKGPRPAGPTRFRASSRPFALGARLFIASADRHIHPFIRGLPRRRRSTREEADGRRESSSFLGDGLGHALAAMVGPAW